MKKYKKNMINIKKNVNICLRCTQEQEQQEQLQKIDRYKNGDIGLSLPW